MKRLLAALISGLITLTACAASHESTQQMLHRASITCQTAPSPTGTECRYRQENITVSTATSWAATADLRHQACTDGYVNPGYRVATGRGIVIAPGVTSPDVFVRLIHGLVIKKYCA